jgi:uncharacterized protein
MMRRHEVLAVLAMVTGAVMGMGGLPAYGDAGPSLPSAKVVKDKVAEKAFAFDLSEVQLLDGPFKKAQDMDRRDLMAANLDNYLYPFRREAKIDNPGTGSNRLDYTQTGHVAGHYLSAAAFIIRNTSDSELKKKADGLVASMADCQDATKNGFLGGFPEKAILVLEGRENDASVRAGVPWYCLHKIYAGLLDMYVLTGNKQALDVLKKAADWAISITDPLTDDQFQRMLGTEHGGMNEVLANLYGVTGDEKYLKLAQRFNHHRILDPFATPDGDSLEPRIHANTQFPKFIGVSRQYELTGETDLGNIERNFWTNVVYNRSYVTGGNSLGEQFTPKATFSQTVGNNTTETCNEYNMLKLTRALFTQDPRPEYADYYERTLYNQILSTRNPQTGAQLYFQQLQSGRKKGSWMLMNQAQQCCFGSGLESNAKYADTIYFNDGKSGLYVNLFMPSELNWKEQGIKVKQVTNYPDEGATRLEFTCDKPTDLTINVRHPWWAKEGYAISVNGQKQGDAGSPGSYVQVKRTFKTGDVIEVAMPMAFYTEAFKDNPKKMAVMYGPLVMAAVTEPNNRLSAIVTQNEGFLKGEAFKRLGTALEFEGPGTAFRTSKDTMTGSITFKPLMRMLDESYVVYWDRMTPEELAAWTPPVEPARGGRGGNATAPASGPATQGRGGN